MSKPNHKSRFQKNRNYRRASDDARTPNTTALPPQAVKMTPENLELDMPPYSKITHEAWLKLFFLRCRPECPDYVCILKGIEPSKPIKPSIPTAREARNKAIMRTYEINYRRYLDKFDEHISQKKKMCSHLWRCISEPIREYISSKDPLAESKHRIRKLLKLTQQAYFSAEHSTPAAQKQSAEDDYYHCRQSPEESVPVFFNRFKDLHTDCVKRGMTAKTDKELAYSFIKKLDNARYIGLDLQCTNGETLVESMDEDARSKCPYGFPRTLDKAFHLANSWVVSVMRNNKHKPVLASNLVTLKSKDKSKSSKPKGKDKRNWIDLDKVKPSDKPSKLGFKSCSCGGDHFKKFCKNKKVDRSSDSNKDDNSDSEKDDKKKKNNARSFSNAIILAQQDEFDDDLNQTVEQPDTQTRRKSKKARTNVTLTRKMIYYVKKYGFGEYTALGDNGCNAPMTPCDWLVTSIRKSPKYFRDVNTMGGPLSVSRVGESLDFGTLGYRPHAEFTVFSFYKSLVDNHKVTYDPDHKFVDVFIARINFTLRFFRYDDILVCDLKPYRQCMHSDVPERVILPPESTFQRKRMFVSLDETQSESTPVIPNATLTSFTPPNLDTAPDVESNSVQPDMLLPNEPTPLTPAIPSHDAPPPRKAGRKKDKKPIWNLKGDELPSSILLSKYKMIPNMTNKQVKALDRVHRGLRNTWHCSKVDLIHRLDNGELKNANFTAADVRNYFTLFDKDFAALKGKSEHETYVVPDLIERIDVLKDEILLRGDLMFVCGYPFLLLIAYPSGFALVNYIKSRDASDILPAMRQSINWFKARNRIPKVLNFDSEPGVIAIKADIEELGCECVINPHGVKVNEAENLIKTIKQRIRSKVATLGFVVGRIILIHLVIAAVIATNFISKKTNMNMQSSYSMLFNKTVDYNVMFRYSPSDYVEVSEDKTNNDADKFRTVTAIPLYPNISNPHSWKFFSLKSRDTFDRNVDAATPLPMSESVIARLNAIAEADPIRRRDPAFHTSLVYTDREGVEILDGLENLETVPASDLVPKPDTTEPTPTNDNADHVAPDVTNSDTLDDLSHDPDPLTDSQEPYIPPDDDGYGFTVNPTTSDQLSMSELDSIDSSGVNSYRRSARTHAQNPKYYNASYINATYIDPIGYTTYRNMPKSGSIFSTQLSARKALEHYNQDGLDAIIAEINGMLDRKVFVGVLRSSLSKTQMKKIIRSSMFVKEKFDSKGTLLKLKARLVAGGHMQNKAIYTVDQISSPTVSTTSFFTLAAIAAAERRHVMTFDIGQAYLNAEMKGDVFMILDPLSASILCDIDPSYREFVDTKGQVLVKLTKALYGCIESAKLWYNHLKAKLLELGYIVNPSDICVFNRTSESGKQSTVCFHVDDGFASCDDLNDLKLLETQLKKIFKQVEIHHGKVHEYLGMNLDFTEEFVCTITMEQYIKNILTDNKIHKKARTPSGGNLFEIDESSEKLDKTGSEEFHKVVAQLLYLGTRVRPDILLPVTFLCSRVSEPSMQDVSKLTRVMCYLNQTADLGLKIGGDMNGELRLLVYADASFAVHPNSMRSHTGIILSVGRGPILVKSYKQKLVTKSSTEAELVSLSDATSLSAAEIQFLLGQGIEMKAEIQQDNTSTIKLANNGRSNSDRTRHVKIRYFFIKQYLDSGEMTITHCPTLEMVADILTKPLQGEHFDNLRDQLLGYKHI